MRWTLQCPRTDRVFEAELLGHSEQGYCFKVDSELLWIRKPWNLQSERWTDKEWRASLGDQVYELKHLSALSEGQTEKGKIQSQMPGRVLKVLCQESDIIEKDQSLMVIEAMKMENEIRSEMRAKVKKIHVSENESIEAAQNLIDLEALKES